jgi:hypothetical protein
MTDNLSPETLAGAPQLSTSDGGGTVVQPALTLEQLNATLGSTFKDADTALKSLKDTQSFVGKRREDIATELKATMAPPTDTASKADVQQLRNELFYSQNPQLKPYQNVLSQMGADPSEVAARPEVKEILEKAKAADEVTQAKSVVNTNSRLSQPSAPVMEQMVAVANARGTTMEDVAIIAARAINAEGAGQTQ